MGLNNGHEELEKLERQYLRLKKTLPRKMGLAAVSFLKRNFKVGGYVSSSFKKWKEPSSIKKGSTTMVQSGNLRRSIKLISGNSRRAIIQAGGNLAYAKIHNEGGRIPVTPKMRRYFWYMFQKTGKEQWKAMALMSKQFIDIPQRQFMPIQGEDNPAMITAVERAVIKELKILQR